MASFQHFAWQESALYHLGWGLNTVPWPFSPGAGRNDSASRGNVSGGVRDTGTPASKAGPGPGRGRGRGDGSRPLPPPRRSCGWGWGSLHLRIEPACEGRPAGPRRFSRVLLPVQSPHSALFLRSVFCCVCWSVGGHTDFTAANLTWSRTPPETRSWQIGALCD